MTASNAPISYRRLAVYFIPLAVQAASQSLTYPLVAMVASRGEGGTLNLAGVAQSNIVMFLVGTLGAGLITSGMVYGVTEQGFRRYRLVNAMLGFFVAAIQALICIPFFGHFVFAALLGLPPSIEAPARHAFPLTIILNLLFFLRNPYQVLLYNNGASGKAMAATLLRIGATLALAPVFCAAGLVGPQWAMACQALPLVGETLLSKWLSAPFARHFKAADAACASSIDIVKFTLPLSLSGFIMTLSSMLLGACIARAPSPERMLPAFYLAAGVANPLAFAASRVQNVVLCFCSSSAAEDRTLRFSVAAGVLLSLIPLLLLIPGPAQWYYVSMQRLEPKDLPLVTAAALLLGAYPLAIALRSHCEGVAALECRTSAILASAIAYLAALTVAAFVCLSLGIAGNVIGPVAIIAGNAAALGTLILLLREPEIPHQPPAPVQTGIEG